MKYLVFVVPFALAACSGGALFQDASLLYKPSPKGAGFGPYTVAEYHARVADGQGGLYRIQEPWTRRDAARHARAASRNHEIETASASSHANGTVGLQTDLINAPSRIYTRQEAVNQVGAEAGIFRLSRSSAIRLRRLPDGRVEEKLLYLGLGGVFSFKQTTIYSVGGGAVSWTGWSTNEPT